MRFENLPDDWAQRPITDPDVFEGVADLIVTARSRAEGATYLLLCHPNGHLMQPLQLPFDLGRPAVADLRVNLLSEVARQGVRHVVVVLARHGSSDARADDLALRDAWAASCREVGLALLATAVAGSDDVRALPAASGSEAA